MTLFEVPEELATYAEPDEEKDDSSRQTNLLLNFDLVTFWEREDESQPSKGKIRLLFVPPQGDPTQRGEYEIDLETNPRSRITIRIPFVPISGSGTYRFRLEVQKDAGWEEVASVPLIITEEPISSVLEMDN